MQSFPIYFRGAEVTALIRADATVVDLVQASVRMLAAPLASKVLRFGARITCNAREGYLEGDVRVATLVPSTTTYSLIITHPAEAVEDVRACRQKLWEALKRGLEVEKPAHVLTSAIHGLIAVIDETKFIMKERAERARTQAIICNLLFWSWWICNAALDFAPSKSLSFLFGSSASDTTEVISSIASGFLVAALCLPKMHPAPTSPFDELRDAQHLASDLFRIANVALNRGKELDKDTREDLSGELEHIGRRLTSLNLYSLSLQ